MNALPDVLCIGSALWDCIGRVDGPAPVGADLPGRIVRRPGGVAMNIAMALARLGLRPTLLSAVGTDAAGEALVEQARLAGLDCAHLVRAQHTDSYLAIEASTGLVAAVADVRALASAGELILQPLGDGRLGSAAAPWRGLIVLDGNLSAVLLSTIARSALFGAADLRVAPASPAKAERLRPLLVRPGVTLYANLEEAGVLCGRDFERATEAAAALFAAFGCRALVTDGPRAAADGSASGVLTQCPPEVPENCVTGAGDTFMATHLWAELRRATPVDALDAALNAAARHVAGATFA